MPRLEDLPHLLEDLDRQHLLRRPDAEPAPPNILDACSNDYLGLAALRGFEPVSREVRRGSGASRLVRGTHLEHLELERELADWVGLPAALLFSTGYAANVGAVSAIAGPNDLVVSDELNHASIIDGCRLSRARVEVVPHLDLVAVERTLNSWSSNKSAGSACWVVVEAYFSMDGTTPRLAELRALTHRYGAHLYVDEAHSLGVFGPSGAGLCAEAELKPDVLVGTLGKAVGSQGAFVAGSAAVRTWLWNRARSFVFSTAPSPLLAASTLKQVRRARSANTERREVLSAAATLRSRWTAAELHLVPGSHGPILPLVIGTEERALAAAAKLERLGVRAQAIRPPTVPSGSSRLRVTVRAGLSATEIERLAAAVIEATSAL